MRQGLLSAAAISFLAVAISPAQALVVGTADPGKANSIPFGSTSGGFVYQQVYNATNFPSPLNINEITFYNFTSPGGTPMTGHFDIYLSNTTAQVGALPTDVPAGFPASLTKVFSGTLPSVSAGRLDFQLPTSFLYDPSLANLLMTVVSFDFATQANPLFLDAEENAGTIFSRRFSAGGGNASVGLVTGFDDPAPTPLPGALPLFVSGLTAVGLIARRRKRNQRTA